ncbi:MAG TPA: response regulator [bacterium]|nr:response regulator [bacterium]
MEPLEPQFRVLIVDDDRDLALNLQDILESRGYSASVAATAAEGLEAARRQVFDLAVVDVRLPDMPGTALIEKLILLCPGLESILITGFVSLETAIAAIRQKHIVAYEVKPVDLDRLIAVLEQVARKKRLERELLDVRERERGRIGRELHDGLGQHLTGIALHAQVLCGALKDKKLAEADHAFRIAHMINEAIQEAGRLARGLAPVVLEQRGLKAALEELTSGIETASGVPCRLEWSPDVRDPGQDAAIHVYRLVQEAVNNAAKHAAAKAVRVQVAGDGEGTMIRISDDGVGLPEKASEKGGMGLNIMRYRAGVIGASLELMPNENGGTVVCVRCRRWM